MHHSYFLKLILPTLLALTTAAPLTQRNTILNEFLTNLLKYLPAINTTINDATSIITDLDTLLAKLVGAKTTQNQLISASTSGSSCAEWTLIWARGTSEPGNMGVLVGPPLVWALQDIVGTNGLTIQGVNSYSASVAGYLAGGDASGSANMASLITQAHKSCPNTKLIAAGYSQGCQVTHNAISQLDAATAAWIDKVLLFGDPDNGQAIPHVNAANVYTVCHPGDDICLNGDLILVPHLTYAENVAAAAAFATA
ncbi:cutinase, putative [Talaromyces stipitatus ATCC 10500]|uniref:cutinase n=1 Tax=Talaromyces stipitatus (strain ATCC 10500 / CBS 375.48 / QM 6759 / NRRL 1006) TaxID=441959 RepID=B8M9W6_TALSN|nr:cutinase, putative [Talaromyces stipitatus ATCC 10500]EED18118.1 cutinase, putative [Talaromyces stipitatus ATCC 10500]